MTAKIEQWIECAVWEIDSLCLETGAFFNRNQAANIIAAHAPKEKAAWEAKEKALQDLALHLEALSDEMNERHPKDYVGLRLAYEYSANKLREILNSGKQP